MVSVCMATFNGEKYIREQLGSILQQLGPSDELVISDDTSTDRTLEIIKSFNDPRIKVWHHRRTDKNHSNAQTHYYASDNFENALSHSNGDIIILSDQDDIWLPGKVEAMSEALRDADLVIHNRKDVDADLNVINEKGLPPDYISTSMVRNMIVTGFSGSCMGISRKLLDFALPFPEDTCTHDTWIGRLAVMLRLPMKFIDRPLILYRIHGGNVSNATEPDKNNNSLLFKLYYRIKLISDVMKRVRNLK